MKVSFADSAFLRRLGASVALTATLALAASARTQVTSTWTGAFDNEIGNEIGIAPNWTSILPGPTNDVMQWDGTQAGALSLVYATNTLGGGPGNAGVNLLVTSTQTSAVNIDSGATASPGPKTNVLEFTTGGTGCDYEHGGRGRGPRINRRGITGWGS